MTRRVVVVGGGITGLTTAYRLRQLLPDAEIAVIESDHRVGGKISSSPFAGLDGIDEGADAFLTRIPFAVNLAAELGLTAQLTSPAVASAYVWWNAMHNIPEGLMLGVPTDLAKLAKSDLLTWPGKLRAALEPILPATGVGADSVGRLIRHRFGKQVHERLVDPLVGSIYAADTDRFSLSGVTQILDLASNNRSLLIGARRARRKAPPTAGPIFGAPSTGMATLTNTLAQSLRASGVTITTGCRVESIDRSGTGWLVNGEFADAVVLATPAKTTAPLVTPLSPDAGATLAKFDHAGVVMLTIALPGDHWPAAYATRSGYLVPKPVQKWVTATSFASSKWAHWQPKTPEGGVILRISLGRDGLDLTDQPEDKLINAALSEVGSHVGFDLQPTEYRLTRWPAAFPQYRPGHAKRVLGIETALATDAPGIFVCGASYKGIGIPACVQQANSSAQGVAKYIGVVLS
jgi:oxygen-dependent protoporphyrinogen oxidase